MNTAVYSLDMSAAFDLLKPDCFLDVVKNKLEPGMVRILMDFLSNRRYTVSVGGKSSSHRNLDRGCVQGSVLGPSLFSIYCGNLQEAVGNEAWITSYADDTYVIVSGNYQDELSQKLKKHCHNT